MVKFEANGMTVISIHAPREGSDHRWRLFFGFRQFQSTLPVRGATFYLFIGHMMGGFQSTLPVRGATPASRSALPGSEISIHAPREGSDSGTMIPAR